VKKIEVVVLNHNPADNRAMLNLAANISQKGQKLKRADQLKEFIQVPSDQKVERLVGIPHASLQKLFNISVLFLNVSRRFLAQVTRHQNDIHFMSSSLRYANHENDIDFVWPYEILTASEEIQENYKAAMLTNGSYYCKLVKQVGNDAAGYAAPQSLRTSILATATAYQWKHMINQRTCKRAGAEMRYVMLQLWRLLHKSDPVFFSADTTGPDCANRGCQERGWGCKNGYGLEETVTPSGILAEEFPLLYKEEDLDVHTVN
jgi:thymidylate synthase (FAD)